MAGWRTLRRAGEDALFGPGFVRLRARADYAGQCMGGCGDGDVRGWDGGRQAGGASGASGRWAAPVQIGWAKG